MSREKLRDRVGELIYTNDISVEGVTVKTLVDLFMEFGEYCAREGYRKGKCDEIIKTKEATEETFVKDYFRG